MTAETRATPKVTDPVCGMEVNPAEAPQTREVMGQTYYFCSNYCAQIFDPEMTGADLARLQVAIGGTGDRARRTPLVWAKDIANGALEKLMDLLFGR
jgi:YHS domain-containing protein